MSEAHQKFSFDTEFDGRGGVAYQAPRPKRLYPLEEVEQRYLAHTIARHGGNRSEAARALGIGRNTLLRKLKESGGEGT